MNEKLTKMKKVSGESQKRNGRRRKDWYSKKLDKKTVRCQRKNKMEGNISLSELKHGKKKIQLWDKENDNNDMKKLERKKNENLEQYVI